jgi:hypothetical protein
LECFVVVDRTFGVRMGNLAKQRFSAEFAGAIRQEGGCLLGTQPIKPDLSRIGWEERTKARNMKFSNQLKSGRGVQFEQLNTRRLFILFCFLGAQTEPVIMVDSAGVWGRTDNDGAFPNQGGQGTG